MLPSDLENYLSEISRVLRSDGRCLVSFFLLNAESETLVRAGSSSLDFQFEIERCRTIDKNNPEFAIAYQESDVLALFAKYGLNVAKPIHYGSWCKRVIFLSYQDLVLAKKEHAHRARGSGQAA
jgi:hypothetical protein